MNSNTVNSFFKVATSNRYIRTRGLLTALAALLFVFLPTSVNAQSTPLFDNFDSYSTGDLASQSDWDDGDVFTTYSYSSSTDIKGKLKLQVIPENA